MAYSLGISTSQSTNPGANQSTVYVTGTLYTGGQSYANYSTSWAVVIGGVTVNSGSGPSELWDPNSYSFSGQRTFDHNPDGTRGTVSTAVYFSGGGGFAPGDLGTGGTTYGTLDFSRPAGAPSYCSASNVSNTITVNWGQAPAPFGPVTYYWIYRSSSNGGATWSGWSGETATSGLSTSGTYTAGQTYQFAVRAANSDGGGGWVYSNTIFLTAGGKRWTGSNWALTTTAAKRWTGSAWTNITTAKRFDGTNWVNLS